MGYGPPWKPEFQPLSQGWWICTNRILGFRQSSLNHRIQVLTSRQSLWLSYRSPSSPCYFPLSLSSSGRANDLAGLPLLPPDYQAKRSSRYTAHPPFHHVSFRAQEPLPHDVPPPSGERCAGAHAGRTTKKGPRWDPSRWRRYASAPELTVFYQVVVWMSRYMAQFSSHMQNHVIPTTAHTATRNATAPMRSGVFRWTQIPTIEIIAANSSPGSRPFQVLSRGRQREKCARLRNSRTWCDRPLLG